MANQEHVKILLSGVENWNRWRKENPGIKPDLSGADIVKGIKEVDLVNAIFRDANLSGANFAGIRLDRANFENAILISIKLFGSSLENVNFRKADLSKAILCYASLRSSCLMLANIEGADLLFANLDNASVLGVKFDRKGRYRGIDLGNCHGSQRFRRHAMDQDYIEEFRENHRILYGLWKATSDCGRSLVLWAAWSLAIAIFFGVVFAGYTAPDWLPGFIKDGLCALGPEMGYHNAMEPNWFTPYYFSVVTFTTLGFGDVTPLNLFGQFWLTLEVVFGYLTLGGLVSIIANKMVRLSG